jgi:hypothetical protein
MITLLSLATELQSLDQRRKTLIELIEKEAKGLLLVTPGTVRLKAERTPATPAITPKVKAKSAGASRKSSKTPAKSDAKLTLVGQTEAILKGDPNTPGAVIAEQIFGNKTNASKQRVYKMIYNLTKSGKIKGRI